MSLSALSFMGTVSLIFQMELITPALKSAFYCTLENRYPNKIPVKLAASEPSLEICMDF